MKSTEPDYAPPDTQSDDDHFDDWPNSDGLEKGARSLGIRLDRTQFVKFYNYYRELREWNRRINLTSVDQWDKVQRVHFVDSLTITNALPKDVLANGSLVDVGSGAGFPGLPLKIAFPTLGVTLVESVQKKTHFLKHIVSILDLTGVVVLAERGETLAHRLELRESYDVAVARAVFSLPATLEVTLPFCRVGGKVIIQKKGDVTKEIQSSQRAIELLGGRLSKVWPVSIPGLKDNRVLVVIEKVFPTPKLYPRRPGMPRKHPL